GLVTSTSLIVNLPHSEAGAAIARRLPGLSVGVHLNLSKGEPLLPADQVPSLVDEAGRFWETAMLYRHALTGQINWYEAAAEMEAQVEWAIGRGLHLDNLDSHVHFHVLPAARRLITELGQRYHVQAWRSPKVLSTLTPRLTWTDLLNRWSGAGPMIAPQYLLSMHQWGERMLEDQRLRAVLTRPGTVTELVVHPGYAPDPELPVPDQLPPERRHAEVDLLRSAAFRSWLDDTGLALISFASLHYVAA
ncbi:MAG: ChbG/HpnK family deacetylase, partial [Anaerolineae bacterium]|nr:ChbG/HpnK family deacetylase [Anaerolineae bacterium]